MSWVKDRLGDIFWTALVIPYCDQETVGLLLGIMEKEDMDLLPESVVNLLYMSGADPLDPVKMSWRYIIAAFPYLDKNIIRLVSLGYIDLYEGAELETSENAELDPLSTDPTSSKSSDANGRVMTDGGYDVNRNDDGFDLGSVLGIVTTVGKVAAVVGILILGISFIGSSIGLLQDNPVTNYAGFAVDEADDAAAGTGQDVAGEASNAVGGPLDSLMCALSGPGCLRQQQADQRPGAEDVGETYGLEIENFEVGSSGGVDVSYQDPESSISTSFRVSNPMTGRKGINARDVMYRVKIIDGDRGVDNPYCDTGWLHLGNSDVDGDNDGPGGNDDIRKGTTSGTGYVNLNRAHLFGSEDGEDANVSSEDRAAVNPEEYDIRYVDNAPLTYKSCEMLQTSLGESRKAVLRLRYDYYSGGRTTFEAMSRSYMLDQDITPETQATQSPDTPVQAAVNVKSPVTFNEENGIRESLPFGMEVFTETDKSGLRYRIRGIEVINSGYTSGVENSCTFRNLAPGERMELTDSMAQRVIYQQDISELDYWYEQNDQPPTMGCTMVLGDRTSNDNTLLNQISRSGETLAYRVRANYTVSMSEPMNNFEVSAANACDQMECPRLVTLSENLSDEWQDYNYKTQCTGVDAYGGCSIVNAEWGSFDSLEKLNSDDVDETVEEGEVAVSLDKFDGSGAIGLEPSRYKNLDSNMDGNLDSSPGWKSYSVISFETQGGERDARLLQLSDSQCSNGNLKPDYPEADVLHSKCSKDSSESTDTSSDQDQSESQSDTGKDCETSRIRCGADS